MSEPSGEQTMACICVFCGSRSGNDNAHAEAARQLGVTLTAHGHSIVYGGGSVGLMGELADAALQHRGRVIGVIPEALAKVEVMHQRVADMRIVPDMHVRKATMHRLADGYIALPGGYGTLEELFEVLCWAQLEFHASPVAMLNLDGYYDGLASLIENMVQQDFLSQPYRQLLTSATSVADLDSWLERHFGTAATTGEK
ncbi:MAG: TIGR00730 family Rossman fold protein [Fuerstiella sp.]|nr:TIGR00730 family Rossman fold protein [Fuerstiella sp.]MCP4855090.1 TIGR00730 family Rossman fold protein [Fuerstiella sp.]